MYGGTQEEMKRLLADAQKLSGVEYDISNLNDVYQAIHVIQTEIGITGTTAKEAAETISGSTAAMKASWQNLLVGFASGDQDLDMLVENFATSLTTVAKNVVPRVITTFKSIGKVLVTNVIGGITENTPQILEKGRESLMNFATGIVNSLPDLIDKTAQVLQNMIAYFKEYAPQFLAVGAEFIFTLATGLIKSIPHLIAGALEVVSDLADYFITFDWLEVGKGIMRGIGNGIASMAEWVVEQAKQVGSRIVESLNGMLGGLFSNQSASKASVTATVGGNVRKNAEGGILTKPTIFGYTPATNTYQLGGEAGAEAIAPISTLQGYVEQSVAKVTGQQTAILQSILNTLAQQGTNKEMTAVVQLDGKTVAKSVFKPLQDITKQHGKSLITT